MLPPSQKGLFPFSHMLFSNVGIWIQSDPSTNSCTFSKPSSVTNGHHSMIELRRRISKCMLFLPSAYHSALIQNWLRSLFTTSCRRIMLRRCYTCNAVRKPCLMNFFSMPAPSSSPHPHPTMASPSSTLTRYGVTANYVPTQQFFHSSL